MKPGPEVPAVIRWFHDEPNIRRFVSNLGEPALRFPAPSPRDHCSGEAPLKNLEDVEEITLSWVQWYSAERLQSYLGNIPPEEFESNYYAKSDVPSIDGAANMTAAR